MIIRGKDKGETGTIKRVVRSQNRVIVEGKNLVSASLFSFFMISHLSLEWFSFCALLLALDPISKLLLLE